MTNEEKMLLIRQLHMSSSEVTDGFAILQPDNKEKLNELIYTLVEMTAKVVRLAT